MKTRTPQVGDIYLFEDINALRIIVSKSILEKGIWNVLYPESGRLETTNEDFILEDYRFLC